VTGGLALRFAVNCRPVALLRIVVCTNVPQIAMLAVCVTEDNAENGL
jgi:hypothetical protein